jgi:hypothetical protein
LGVVELDTQHAFPENDPYRKEQQQAGEADPARHPSGDDAGQQHQPTGEQRQVKLVQGDVNLLRLPSRQ